MRAADLRSPRIRLGGWPGPDLDAGRIGPIARVAIFVALGALAGIVGTLGPIALVGGVAVVGAIWLLSYRTRPRRVFGLAIIGLLIGYAFMGRGFAYLGVPPLYVGEMVLGLGIIATLIAVPKLRGGPVRLLIVAFMAWGAVQTIPYLGRYGVDSLRDAVTWGYALFALLISLTITGRHVDRLTGLYRALIPLYCLWVPVTFALGRIGSEAGGGGGGDEVGLISPKAGDIGVLLAGIAAFALLGLYSSKGAKPRIPEAIMWLLWLPAAVVVAIFNRGGMAAMATAGAVVLFLRLPQRWLPPIFLTLSLGLVLVSANPKIEFSEGRSISVAQFVENISSIVTEGDNSSLEGTKEFRLRWWGDIIDYTVNGPYFWTGKGFGVNLADDDGFQVTADGSLRAPHNGHMEILARTGVPGLLIWLFLNLTIGLGLLAAAARARALDRPRWAAIDGWLFVAWAASLVNASFDPYLQGPQGGIWFWSIVGLAIVAMEASTDPNPEPDTEPPTDLARALDDAVPAVAMPVPQLRPG